MLDSTAYINALLEKKNQRFHIYLKIIILIVRYHQDCKLRKCCFDRFWWFHCKDEFELIKLGGFHVFIVVRI